MKWCYGPTAQLLVADFNNDKRADMLCHETSNGYKWIAYADSAGKFTGTGWEANLGWCSGIAAAQLLLGDFNGDKRADMLCHDPNTGYKWIALADTNGGFTGTSWESDMGWCGTDAQLLLGDFNGDGRTDMLCHRLSDGHKWIAFAAVDGTFPGTSRDWPMDWCAQPDLSVLKSMRIADFDGNGTSDFLCHDASNGYKWIAYQFKQ
jgi:hypothetical protein